MSKGDSEVPGNNQSVVFLGNPASAVSKNMGATNQKCEISSSQLIYLTVYPVNVLQDQNPMKANARIEVPC